MLSLEKGSNRGANNNGNFNSDNITTDNNTMISDNKKVIPTGLGMLEEQYQHQQQPTTPAKLISGASGISSLGNGTTGGMSGAAVMGVGSSSNNTNSIINNTNDYVTDSIKRRGRPRGWTDVRIHCMLAYLKEHFTQFQTGHYLDFYHGLAAHLGDDLDHQEVREKLEKMVKHYENDKRRDAYDWKWYPKLNEIFKGPPLPKNIYYATPGGSSVIGGGLTSALGSATSLGKNLVSLNGGGEMMAFGDSESDIEATGGVNTAGEGVECGLGEGRTRGDQDMEWMSKKLKASLEDVQSTADLAAVQQVFDQIRYKYENVRNKCLVRQNRIEFRLKQEQASLEALKSRTEQQFTAFDKQMSSMSALLIGLRDAAEQASGLKEEEEDISDE